MIIGTTTSFQNVFVYNLERPKASRNQFIPTEDDKIKFKFLFTAIKKKSTLKRLNSYKV